MRPTDLIRTSNDKQDRFARSATRECVDRQIESLFRVNAAEKQKHAHFFDLGKFREKKMACLRSGRARFFNPKLRNFFLGAIKPEGLARLGTFFFRSKNYCRSVAQDPIFGPRPVEPFFEMLERKGALEPGIEHAMRKNKVRNGGFVQALPDGETVVLPDAMDDNAIEFAAMPFEPPRQGTRVTIIGEALAESVHGKRLITQHGRSRFIQSDNLDPYAMLLQSFAQRSDGTGHTARFGIQRLHYLQNSQFR